MAILLLSTTLVQTLCKSQRSKNFSGSSCSKQTWDIAFCVAIVDFVLDGDITQRALRHPSLRRHGCKCFLNACTEKIRNFYGGNTNAAFWIQCIWRSFSSTAVSSRPEKIDNISRHERWSRGERWRWTKISLKTRLYTISLLTGLVRLQLWSKEKNWGAWQGL